MGRNVVRCLTVLASLWMLSGAVRAQTWNEYCSMVQMGLIKPEIAVAWYFELPHETEHDIEEIRRQYMPEIESMTREE